MFASNKKEAKQNMLEEANATRNSRETKKLLNQYIKFNF